MPKNYIKRKFVFPYIDNFDNFELQPQIDFLKKSNSFLKDELNINVTDLNNSFHISEMNRSLLSSIQNIFIDEKINLFKEALSIIESNFYSFDEDIINEKQKLEDNKYESEFNLNKNKFYYSITLTPMRSKSDYSFYDFKIIKENLIDKISSNLAIEKSNILVSFNNKSFFIDYFLRTNEFFSSPFMKIKFNYENLVELHELKMINDLLCVQYELNASLDYRGNFIIPNKNLNVKRGTEKYDPPYGWIGFGLKVINKYDNNEWLDDTTESSKWAIAYHGLGRMSSNDEIKQILKNIISEKEGLVSGPSQIKCHFKDIRHPGKKIGTGVYLTPSINIAEDYSGIIQLNNKKYKIVLMVKVLIKKIRQPEDFNYWILNEKDIRVY
jgi:hypothetical protein